jgi:hypothetical protein
MFDGILGLDDTVRSTYDKNMIFLNLKNDWSYQLFYLRGNPQNFPFLPFFHIFSAGNL